MVGAPPPRFGRDDSGWSPAVDPLAPGGQPVAEPECEGGNPRWVRCRRDQRLHVVAAGVVGAVMSGGWVGGLCGRSVLAEALTFSSESAGLCVDCVAALGRAEAAR